VRHGAATGLREIIKVHGQGAGKTLDASVEEVSKQFHITCFRSGVCFSKAPKLFGLILGTIIHTVTFKQRFLSMKLCNKLTFLGLRHMLK